MDGSQPIVPAPDPAEALERVVQPVTGVQARALAKISPDVIVNFGKADDG